MRDIKAYNAQYYKKNRENILKKVHEYYMQNSEKVKSYQKSISTRVNKKLKQKRKNDVEYREKVYNYISNRNHEKGYYKTESHKKRTKERREILQEKTKQIDRRQWLQHEIDYLVQNYESKTQEQLAIELQRTYCAIGRRASLLGLTKTKKRIKN